MAMGRIIVNNKSDLTDIKALELVTEVIKMGRISNGDKQYCYLTSFKINNKDYCVSTDLRERSDSFLVWEYPTPPKTELK